MVYKFITRTRYISEYISVVKNLQELELPDLQESLLRWIQIRR